MPLNSLFRKIKTWTQDSTDKDQSNGSNTRFSELVYPFQQPNTVIEEMQTTKKGQAQSTWTNFHEFSFYKNGVQHLEEWKDRTHKLGENANKLLKRLGISVDGQSRSHPGEDVKDLAIKPIGADMGRNNKDNLGNQEKDSITQEDNKKDSTAEGDTKDSVGSSTLPQNKKSQDEKEKEYRANQTAQHWLIFTVSVFILIATIKIAHNHKLKRKNQSSYKRSSASGKNTTFQPYQLSTILSNMWSRFHFSFDKRFFDDLMELYRWIKTTLFNTYIVIDETFRSALGLD